MQVYNEHLQRKRVASADELALMLMRSSRPQQVGRRGVHLDIAGQRIDYWTADMVNALRGQEVYYRYDPDDLSEVRLYDLQDRYLMTVPADNTAVLTYGTSKDEVKEAIGKVRRMERITKEALEYSTLPAIGKQTASIWCCSRPTSTGRHRSSRTPSPRYWTCSGRRTTRSRCLRRSVRTI